MNWLGSKTASNGFKGRIKSLAFIANVTSLNILQRVARFTQFYYQDLVTTALIDRSIIVCGTSITQGANASGGKRWVSILQQKTQALVYGHGIGGSRITASSPPFTKSMSAKSSTGEIIAAESYETIIIPYLNVQATAPIVIIDHNVNDNNQTVGAVTLGNLDRSTYVGALNFVANEILATRSNAIIVGQTGFPDARAQGAGTQMNQVNIDNAMRAWCALRGFPCIDVAGILDQSLGLNTYTINNPEFASLLADTVHPTALGHQAIANAVLNEVIRIFG